MKPRGARIRAAEVATVIVASAIALFAGEILFRAVDGYDLSSARLLRLPTSPPHSGPAVTGAEIAKKHAERIPRYSPIQIVLPGSALRVAKREASHRSKWLIGDIARDRLRNAAISSIDLSDSSRSVERVVDGPPGRIAHACQRRHSGTPWRI